MRYILDDLGYIEEVGSHMMQCNGKGCTQYNGTIPEGYDSLEEWAMNANIRAYKIDTSGNLVFDTARDTELQNQFKNDSAKKAILSSYVASGIVSYAKSGNVVIAEVSDVRLNEDRNEWVTIIATGLPKPVSHGDGWIKALLYNNNGVLQIGGGGELMISQRTGTQLKDRTFIGQLVYISQD